MAYAPKSISDVVVNGQSVGYTWTGDYISFPPANFALSAAPGEMAEKKNSDVATETQITPIRVLVTRGAVG